MRRTSSAPAGLAILLAATTMLAGCGIADATKDPRGQRVDRELLGEIVPGVQTRGDITALLGSPTSTAIFGSETWFYIGGVTRNRVGRTDLVVEQEVVAVHFDRAGVVERVEVIEKGQAVPIEPVARVTPTPGNDASFIGMIFGNIGRFGPGGARGQTAPGEP